MTQSQRSTNDPAARRTRVEGAIEKARRRRVRVSGDPRLRCNCGAGSFTNRHYAYCPAAREMT